MLFKNHLTMLVPVSFELHYVSKSEISNVMYYSAKLLLDKVFSMIFLFIYEGDRLVKFI